MFFFNDMFNTRVRVVVERSVCHALPEGGGAQKEDPCMWCLSYCYAVTQVVTVLNVKLMAYCTKYFRKPTGAPVLQKHFNKFCYLKETLLAVLFELRLVCCI